MFFISAQKFVTPFWEGAKLWLQEFNINLSTTGTSLNSITHSMHNLYTITIWEFCNQISWNYTTKQSVQDIYYHVVSNIGEWSTCTCTCIYFYNRFYFSLSFPIYWDNWVIELFVSVNARIIIFPYINKSLLISSLQHLYKMEKLEYLHKGKKFMEVMKFYGNCNWMLK